MKSSLFALVAVFAISASAQAETYFFLNGKLTDGSTAEDATKDPKNVIIKVQANRVTRNPVTGNFKKLSDATVEDLRKALAGLK